jgi:transketolase
MADKATVENLKAQASEMRKLIAKLANKTMVHLGGDMSMADMMTALYMYKMRKNLDYQGKWPERDRFVMSKGHGAGCLYIAMAKAGYGSIEEIFDTYGQYGSRYGMHPCKNQNPGMDASSGSLGQGLSLCAGMALAAKKDGLRHHVFVMLGDGELNEGSIWEGAMMASHYKLGNLIALVDRNGCSLSARTEDDVEGMKLEPLADKWRAFGWNVMEIDGNNMEEIVNALDRIPDADTEIPTVIIGHTTKGCGVSFMEDVVSWHHGVLNDEQLARALDDLCSCDIN